MERVRDHGTAAKRTATTTAPSGRATADRRAQVLQLQRTIGNRATRQALQRLDFDWDDAWDIVKGPAFRLGGGLGESLVLDELVEAAVAYGRAKSTVFTVPASYDTDLDNYAAANPEDGKILKKARARKPTFHVGGLVPDDALAMTLDRDIFCKQGEPKVDTYIHELVHVWQFGEDGRTGFLTKLLGGAAAGVLMQLLRGKAVDIMKASPYEMQAYGVECRFKKWKGVLPDSYCNADGTPK